MKKILILIVLICGALMSLTLPPVDKTKVPIKNVQGLQDSLAAKVNIATLESATDEFYNKTQATAKFIDEAGDTITGVLNVPTAAAGTNTTQAASMVNVQGAKTYVSKLNLAGVASVLGTTWGFNGTIFSNTGVTLTDNTVHYVLLDPITVNTHVTSINYFVQTAFSGTADQTNNVALFSYNGTTYTKVAETANNSSAWTANTHTENLTSAVDITPGIYAIGFLYNNSAQTTAPVISGYGVGLSSNIMNMYPSTFKTFATQSGQNSQPSSVSVSSLSIASNAICVWLK